MNENTDKLLIEDAKVLNQALVNVLINVFPYLKTDSARSAVAKQIADCSSVLSMIDFSEIISSNDEKVQPSLINDIMSVGQGE